MKYLGIGVGVGSVITLIALGCNSNEPMLLGSVQQHNEYGSSASGSTSTGGSSGYASSTGGSTGYASSTGGSTGYASSSSSGGSSGSVGGTTGAVAGGSTGGDFGTGGGTPPPNPSKNKKQGIWVTCYAYTAAGCKWTPNTPDGGPDGGPSTGGTCSSTGLNKGEHLEPNPAVWFGYGGCGQPHDALLCNGNSASTCGVTVSKPCG